MSRNVRIFALGALGVVVFAVHFRPWTDALLEDWQFLSIWNASGWNGWAELVSTTGGGRPLALLPTFAGLALSGGGFVGMWFISGLIALGQFLLVVWAMHPLRIASSWVLSIATVLALHPWWGAGEIIRFHPAEFSLLLLCAWFGCAVRAATSAWWWAIPGTVAVIAGMLSYQALALVALVGGLAIALCSPRISVAIRTVVLPTAAAVTAAFVWIVVLVPRIQPAAYESSLGALPPDPIGPVIAILRTVAHGAPVIFVMLLVLAPTIAAALSETSSRRAGVAALLMVAVAPLTALPYGVSGVQLNDPERIAFPIGTTLVGAGIAVAFALRSRRVRGRARIWPGLVAAGAVSVAIGSAFWWQGWTNTQKDLRVAVAGVLIDQPTATDIVIEDRTGRFGDVYSFLNPHLQFAVTSDAGRPIAATICTQNGVQRLHAIAQRLPIATTPDCGSLDLTTYEGRLVLVREGSVVVHYR